MQQLDLTDITANATQVEFPDIRIWASKLKPIPNPYSLTDTFDFGAGSCVRKYFEVVQYLREHELGEENVWTIVTLLSGAKELIQGVQYHDATGYIVTENEPQIPFYGEIYVPRNY